MAPSANVVVEPAPGRDLIAALLERHGASAANARQVAEHLMDASLAGLHSHGLLRVPQYLQDMAIGDTDPRATPDATHTGSEGIVVVDGRRSFGQVAGNWAIERGLALAAQRGVGALAVRRIGHAGRIGAYVERAARRGAVAIAACSGPPHGHRVAPFGALEGRMATNPIAYAYPCGDGAPVVADFATSASTEGAARVALMAGAAVPEGTMQDAEGAPTTDPGALYAEPPGTLLPLGGPRFGHKGYALGLLVEALATLAAGDEVDDRSRFGNNLFVLVLAVDDGFADRAARMGAYMRTARARPAGGVELPGDRERHAAQRAPGASVDAGTWAAIRAAALAAGLDAATVDGALAADGERHAAT